MYDNQKMAASNVNMAAPVKHTLVIRSSRSSFNVALMRGITPLSNDESEDVDQLSRRVGPCSPTDEDDDKWRLRS